MIGTCHDEKGKGTSTRTSTRYRPRRCPHTETKRHVRHMPQNTPSKLRHQRWLWSRLVNCHSSACAFKRVVRPRTGCSGSVTKTPSFENLAERTYRTDHQVIRSFISNHELVEGGGSSWTMTRLHTMIGLTGYRTRRDLLRIRRALYRLIGRA
jgi:hypothetical protein